MADDQAIKVSYCVNGHPGVSHTENECPVCHALAETRGLTSRLNAREEEVKAHMELLAAAMERAEKAEKERDQAQKLLGYRGHDIEAMAMNSSETLKALRKIAAERDSLRRALEKYGHHVNCYWDAHTNCECGLTGLLAARALAGQEDTNG